MQRVEQGKVGSTPDIVCPLRTGVRRSDRESTARFSWLALERGPEEVPRNTSTSGSYEFALPAFVVVAPAAQKSRGAYRDMSVNYSLWQSGKALPGAKEECEDIWIHGTCGSRKEESSKLHST